MRELHSIARNKRSSTIRWFSRCIGQSTPHHGAVTPLLNVRRRFPPPHGGGREKRRYDMVVDSKHLVDLQAAVRVLGGVIVICAATFVTDARAQTAAETTPKTL